MDVSASFPGLCAPWRGLGALVAGRAQRGKRGNHARAVLVLPVPPSRESDPGGRHAGAVEAGHAAVRARSQRAHPRTDEVAAALEGAKARERLRLERNLAFLATLGSNAPFIGLFGTVLGIIKAFHDLAGSQAGGPSVVMAGISEALVATAVGLMVAIPAVVAFNYFSRRVRCSMAQVDWVAQLAIAEVTRPRWQVEPAVRREAGRLMAGKRTRRQRRNAVRRHQRHAAGRRDAGAAHHLHGGGAADRRTSRRSR